WVKPFYERLGFKVVDGFTLLSEEEYNQIKHIYGVKNVCNSISDESFVRFYAPYDHFYAMSLLKDLYFLFLDSSVVGNKYKDIFSKFPEFMRYSISHFVLILKKEQ